MNKEPETVMHDLHDLVAPVDIAKRAGVSVNTVSMWAYRNDDYPAVIKIAGKTPLRSWVEVAAWLRRTGRLEPEKGRIYDESGLDVTDDYKPKKVAK